MIFQMNQHMEFYTIDSNYIKYLHQYDSEVFYDNTAQYGRKPYVGILLNSNGYNYFIPLTSAKEKHKNWDNVTATNYLIYEIIPNPSQNHSGIIRTYPNSNKAKKILAVLEIKKMIPVKSGYYARIDFNQLQDLAYKNLLQKEYYFCLPHTNGIIQRANKIYTTQCRTNKVLKYHCNFKLLEAACDSYSPPLSSQRQS